MTILDFTLRILFAVLLGSLIGIERQLTGHVAGIRINVLVCLGTCMFVVFSLLMDVQDTTRIAAQIVSGVGFLCSGIIFKDGIQVRGLNTAATIWCTAAIGVLTSSGKFLYAAAATAILLISNIIFRPIANHVNPLDCFEENERYYRVSITCTEDDEMKIRSAIMNYLMRSKFLLTNLESADVIGNKVEIEADLKSSGKKKDETMETVVRKISLEKGVTSIGWEVL